MIRSSSILAIGLSLGLVGILSAIPIFAQQPKIKIDQDPRNLKLKPLATKVQAIKFLPNAKLMEAFKAKKVKIDGKSLSAPVIFTPRNIYSSDSLYVEVDHVMTSSAIDNVWHVNHHNGFYLVYKPTDRKPFIVTLYGRANWTAHTITTARTRLYRGSTMTSESSFDHDQTIRSGETLAIPVVVTSPDEINTVRYWTTQDSFDVTAIELRTLD